MRYDDDSRAPRSGRSVPRVRGQRNVLQRLRQDLVDALYIAGGKLNAVDDLRLLRGKYT